MTAQKRTAAYWRKARQRRYAASVKAGRCVDCTKKAKLDTVLDANGELVKVRRSRCAEHLAQSAERWRLYMLKKKEGPK